MRGADGAACGGCADLRAADRAVFWNSIAPGVPALKKSWEVEGEGAGNMEPDPPGVSPLRMPDSLGVRPVRRCESNPRLTGFVGPWSIAGDRGPDRRELAPQL